MGFHIDLRRNSMLYPFPPLASPLEQKQMVHTISEALFQSGLFVEPNVFDIHTLSPTERAFLFEHYAILPAQEEEKGPHIIVDLSGNIAIIIYNEDHLQFVAYTSAPLFHQTWHTIQALEAQIGTRFPYAFSKEYGFLTQSLAHAGTGLLLESYLHLPLLLSHPDELQKELPDFIECVSPGAFQDVNICLLCSKYRIGFSEDEIVSALISSSQHLQEKEHALREEAIKVRIETFQDRIGRAYGLLLHSKVLDAEEARRALSDIKLGISLNLIHGVQDQDINALIFQNRRGHVSMNHPKEPSIEKARAHLVKETMKKITLTF